MKAENDIPERISALNKTVRDNLKEGLDKSVQEELASIINMLPDIEKSENLRYLEAAETAVSSLALEKPNVDMAKNIRKNLERRVRLLRNPVRQLFTSGTPPTRVILGLGVLLYFAIPLLVILSQTVVPGTTVFGIDVGMLVLVGLSGALGSIVSIMVRVHEFTSMEKTDPSVLFFTGFFKPVIGMSFALFVFSVIEGGLIPLDIAEGKAPYFFMAMGFVSGFSERFAKDIVRRAEERISPGADKGN